MKKFVLPLLMSGFLLLTACEIEEPIGSGSAYLQISAKLGDMSTGYAYNSNWGSEIINERLNFTSGYVWLSEIGFHGMLENDGVVTRNIEQFSKIEFYDGISDPNAQNIVIPAGKYTEAYITAELRDEDNQPSIVMEGTYLHSAEQVEIPIRFEFNSGEEFETQFDVSGLFVLEGDPVFAKILFDSQVLFSVVSNENLDRATLYDGVIVISESKNEAIFDLVADRLSESTIIFIDRYITIA